MENRNMITVADENGNAVECEVLFTFTYEENGKNYMVYTDNTVDDEGNAGIYAATFELGVQPPALHPIETEAEWQMLDRVLENLVEEAYGIADEGSGEEE